MNIEKLKDNESYLEWLEKNVSLYKKLVEDDENNYEKSSNNTTLYRGHYLAFVAALDAYNKSQEDLLEVPEWAK